jgi:hypothetical protein
MQSKTEKNQDMKELPAAVINFKLLKKHPSYKFLQHMSVSKRCL